MWGIAVARAAGSKATTTTTTAVSRSLILTTRTMAATTTTTTGISVEAFGEADVLRVKEDIGLPAPGEKQVLLRLSYAGVNPVDTYIRAGTYPKLPALPYTPGGDGAGVVEAVGAGVTGLKAGDRVFTLKAPNGSYARHAVADENTTFKLADRLSFAQGAGIGVPYFTAYRALVLKGELKAGESVLIHGASGAVGTAAVQIAKALGAGHVAGTAGTKDGMELVKKCGADSVFCHRDKGYEAGVAAAVADGFDVVLENLANVNLDRDMKMVKKGTRILVVGNRGDITINPRLLMAPEAKIQGVALMSSTPEEFSRIGQDIVAGIEKGWVNPVVDREYPLEDAGSAHTDIIASAGARGNLVLKIQ